MLVSFAVRSTGTCPNTIRFALSKLRRLHASSQCIVSSYHGFNDNCIDFPARPYSTSQMRLQDGSSVSKDAVTPVSSEDIQTDQYRERFIPITRQSVIRYLVEEKDFLIDVEKKVFPQFANALNYSLMSQYNGILGELKALFDPINPDKETLHTREFSRREKLDNEFWLLQRLDDVMRRANFQELPKPTMDKCVKEHISTVGVVVSVDLNRYDVLRFWVLGHEKPVVSRSIFERMMDTILRRPPRDPKEYYKRVVVATRLKTDSKLILRAFKEVPTQCMEMLLPDGSIKMSVFDKGILMSSISMAGFGIFAKVVTHLADLHVEWTLVMASITGLIGFRAWSLYENKRNKYMIKIAQMLYYKNIANNYSLLAVLVDRAQDECFKEALLTYTFLLASQPAAYRNKPTSSIPHSQLGGLTVDELSKQVEDWVEVHAGVRVQFDTSEALLFLKELGLVQEKDGILHAVMLNVAKMIVPALPVTTSTMLQDSNTIEGFDRDVFLETEEEYRKNEKKMKNYGWF